MNARRCRRCRDLAATGAYATRTPLPFVPGFEGVGTVERVGDQGDQSMIGRRILPLGSAGCWQNYKALPADWCVPVPDDIDDDQAATAYINPLTALLMVEALAPMPRDVVGITAAASAIGRMLIRMLAATGARPIAIVRSEAAYRAVRDEPADAVIREDVAFPALHAGLDAVGGTTGSRLAAAIGPGGQLLHYGLLSGQPLADAGRAELTYFRLRDVVHAMPSAAFYRLMDRGFDEIRAGRAICAIAASYPLDAYRTALEHDAQAGRHGRKVILRP